MRVYSKLNLMMLIILVISSSALGVELQENFHPTRPLGMGNAFTAVANDENAIWTNPAGIARARKARTREWFITKLPNVSLGLNERSKSLYETNSGRNSASFAEAIQNQDDIGTRKPYWAHLGFFPLALFDYDKQSPGAIGFFSNNTSKMLVEREQPDLAKVNFTADMGPVMNFTWTSQSNQFSIGAQVRYVFRYAYEDVVPVNDLADRRQLVEHIEQGTNETRGLGVDVGFLYTAADYWFPTLGVAVLNLPTGCRNDYLNPHTKLRERVCGNKFQGKTSNRDALSTIDPTDVRVGIAITPRLGHNLSLRLAIDAHHLLLTDGTNNYGLSNIETHKRMHAGAELFIGNPLERPALAVRTGLNQGLVTSGLSVNVGLLSIDLATYGADVSSETKTIEDRRYIGTLSLLF